MSIQQKIEDQVSEWTDGQTMFTAYDVTVALRNSGERVSHNDVKNVVHQLHQSGKMDAGYEKTMVQVPGTNAKAFLYHHLTADTDEYEPIAPTYQKSKPSSLKPTIVQRTSSKNAQPSNDILDPAFPKQDGRLTVPMILIKKAGLFRKNYRVVMEPARIIITSNNNPSYTSGDVLMPQAQGVIELPRKYTKHLNKGSYKISLINSDDIYVEWYWILVRS